MSERIAIARFVGDPRGYKVLAADVDGYMGRGQQVGSSSWVKAIITRGIGDVEVLVNLNIAYMIEPEEKP